MFRLGFILIKYLYFLYTIAVIKEIDKTMISLVKRSKAYVLEDDSYHSKLYTNYRITLCDLYEVLLPYHFKTPLLFVYILSHFPSEYNMPNGNTLYCLKNTRRTPCNDYLNSFMFKLKHAKKNKRIKHFVKTAIKLDMSKYQSNNPFITNITIESPKYSIKREYWEKYKSHTFKLRINIILDFISWVFENFFIFLQQTFLKGKNNNKK